MNKGNPLKSSLNLGDGSFFFRILLTNYLFSAALGLRRYAQAFSGAGAWGSPLVAARRLLTAGLLLLPSTGSRAPSSAVAAHGLSCSAIRGFFPDQGLNRCPLHWQADS